MTTKANRGEELRCDEVEPYLPLRGDEALSQERGRALRAHLAGCSACSRFAGWTEELALRRPEPPSGIRDHVLGRIAPHRTVRPQPTWRRREWALPAAAVLVLSLGIGLLWQQLTGPETSWLMALDDPAVEWAGEDWLIAGEPHLDALPYEVLIALLEEM